MAFLHCSDPYSNKKILKVIWKELKAVPILPPTKCIRGLTVLRRDKGTFRQIGKLSTFFGKDDAHLRELIEAAEREEALVKDESLEDMSDEVELNLEALAKLVGPGTEAVVSFEGHTSFNLHVENFLTEQVKPELWNQILNGHLCLPQDSSEWPRELPKNRNGEVVIWVVAGIVSCSSLKVTRTGKRGGSLRLTVPAAGSAPVPVGGELQLTVSAERQLHYAAREGSRIQIAYTGWKLRFTKDGILAKDPSPMGAAAYNDGPERPPWADWEGPFTDPHLYELVLPTSNAGEEGMDEDPAVDEELEGAPGVSWFATFSEGDR